MPDSPPSTVYPVTISLPVQWGDQDAFGHVNNVVHFRWMESARIAYFAALELGDMMTNQGVGPILASIKCDYRRQLVFPDTVRIGASVTRIGRTSLAMVHRIESTAQQAVVAEGESVIVMFDYTAQQPTPVSDAIRAKIADLQEGKATNPKEA